MSDVDIFHAPRDFEFHDFDITFAMSTLEFTCFYLQH